MRNGTILRLEVIHGIFSCYISHAHTLSFSVTSTHPHTRTLSLSFSVTSTHPHTRTLSLSLSHPHIHTHVHSLSLSLSHPHIHTHVHSLSLSFSVTSTHPHTRTLSLSFSVTSTHPHTRTLSLSFSVTSTHPHTHTLSLSLSHQFVLPLIIHLVDAIINRRLQFGYDIGKGFVVGEEEMLLSFDRIGSVVHKNIAQELRRRAESTRLSVIQSLGESIPCCS